MADAPSTSKVSQWMFFLGVLFLLMGAYGFVRIVHVDMRKVPYPSSGVLPQTLLVGDVVSLNGRESDCGSYPQLYYEVDGKTLRDASEEEAALQDEMTKRCVNGFDEDRAKQRQRDRNESAFLVFVGAGLVFARRFLS